MIIDHSGISGSRTAYLLAEKIREKKKLLAVVSSGQAAARLADDLVFYMPELDVIVLPDAGLPRLCQISRHGQVP